jgi:hypothetical protein
MAQISRSPFPEKMNKTCVLYDRHSGAISHIQHAVVLQGGHEPTEDEIEAMARKSFEKRGLSHANLHALHLAGDSIKPGKVYQVDPARKELVETEWTRNRR